MSSDFLDTVVAKRRDAVLAEYGRLEPADCERLACCAREPLDFAVALSDREDVAVIAEVKKSSPSAGPIAPDCEASKQALHYQDGGAAAVSVLTEPEYFGGSYTDLSDVADALDIPVLDKDFVVDPVQLFVARGHAADAVLLMVSVLGPLVGEYADTAATLGLTPLVEVSDSEELRIALLSGARVIGVNSRDLRTLNVDRRRALDVIAEAASEGVTVVAASGVRERADVEAAAEAGAHAVLVGEVLMRSPFPEELLEELTGVAKGSATTRSGIGS